MAVIAVPDEGIPPFKHVLAGRQQFPDRRLLGLGQVTLHVLEQLLIPLGVPRRPYLFGAPASLPHLPLLHEDSVNQSHRFGSLGVLPGLCADRLHYLDEVPPGVRPAEAVLHAIYPVVSLVGIGHQVSREALQHSPGVISVPVFAELVYIDWIGVVP